MKPKAVALVQVTYHESSQQNCIGDTVVFSEKEPEALTLKPKPQHAKRGPGRLREGAGWCYLATKGLRVHFGFRA